MQGSGGALLATSSKTGCPQYCNEPLASHPRGTRHRHGLEPLASHFQWMLHRCSKFVILSEHCKCESKDLRTFDAPLRSFGA